MVRKILEKITNHAPAQVAVTLDHAGRQKSRGLLKLDDGTEAALLLERGNGLRHGDRLLADDGVVVVVEAAREGLSIVTCTESLDLMRAAYHLGNRHIPVQIEALRLAYLHDHVLDDMVRALGFQVGFAVERFEPESGAYGGRGEHGHSHAQRDSEALRAHAPHAHGPAHEPALRTRTDTA
ncbi:MAG TPA: urease accessory protein UreE [Polyangiaceae bacterium]|jgi:urease accessory protein|nr:urease accessory protein UreE [Polyangiaceae bacterium]